MRKDGNAEAVTDELLGTLVIGGQEDLEGRILRNLRIELAGGAEAQHSLVAGLLLEGGRNLLCRIGEVRGDRDIGLCRVSLLPEWTDGE